MDANGVDLFVIEDAIVNENIVGTAVQVTPVVEIRITADECLSIPSYRDQHQ